MGVLAGFIRVSDEDGKRDVEQPQYFKGTIKKSNDNGHNFDVAYDNGTSERGALHTFIRTEEEGENEVTSSSHHRRLRRRIFRNRSIKLPEGYFPIILALLVLITVSWILIRLPMLQGPNEIETTRSPASPGP